MGSFGAGGGLNAHIFQPPKSPASAFASPGFATGTSDYFGSAGSRKRSRADSKNNKRAPDTPSVVTPGWEQYPTPADASSTSAFAQNFGSANERYRLAGGFDTPGLMTGSEMEQRQLHFGPLARERNGTRLRSSPNGPAEKKSSWTGMAFNLVGNLFSFGTSVFKGFYAGGGQGYAMPRNSPYPLRAFSDEVCTTPLPGAWQNDEDFLGDFEQDNPHSPSSGHRRPVNKRRQTDRESWVVVGTPEVEARSPRRKQSGTDIPTRHTIAGRPTASRAYSRRSLVPQSRRQTEHGAFSSNSPAQLQVPMSPTRRASFAPIRSNSRPSSSSGNAFAASLTTAYISPEAERYVKRKAKHDRQAESAIGDMSRKLADLIRQGQEALGTKYSVEGGGIDDEDEGFVDEDY